MADQTAAQYREFARLNVNSRKYRREMDSLFPGGWDEEMLAEHLCFKKTGKHLNELDTPGIPGQTQEANPAIQEVTPPEVVPPAPNSVEERYQEYLQYFQPEAPNDILDLRLLCENELTLARLHERRLRMLETSARASDIKAIIDSIAALTDTIGRIQKRLGIDRITRGSSQDAGDKLMMYVDRARSVLHRQGIPILCTNCYHTPAKIVNLFGFLVWHLQDESVEWRFEFECPRCHTKMVYTPANLNDLKAMAGWK